MATAAKSRQAIVAPMPNIVICSSGLISGCSGWPAMDVNAAG